MNRELKTKWIGALRSGAYKQGVFYLKSLIGDQEELYEYCCLGVLCDIAGKKFKSCRQEGYEFTQECEGDIYELTDSLLDEFMISEIEMNKLIKMNDAGVTFSNIANWIEKEM